MSFNLVIGNMMHPYTDTKKARDLSHGLFIHGLKWTRTTDLTLIRRAL